MPLTLNEPTHLSCIADVSLLFFSPPAETVKGAKSVFLPVMFTSLRSVITYRNVSTVCALIVDLLEESISLDALNFILSLMFVIAQTSVGLDYGPGKYGQIRWLCTLRTRYVNRLAFSEFPPSALQEFNAAIDSHSQAMSLAEIKQHNQTVLLLKERERENKRNGNLQKDGGNHPLEFMNDRDIKQLTKVSGEEREWCVVAPWSDNASCVCSVLSPPDRLRHVPEARCEALQEALEDAGHQRQDALRTGAGETGEEGQTLGEQTTISARFLPRAHPLLPGRVFKAMTLAGFTTFVRKLSPNLDARYVSCLSAARARS